MCTIGSVVLQETSIRAKLRARAELAASNTLDTGFSTASVA